MCSENQGKICDSLLERNKRAAFLLRETIKNLHSFKMLYHQSTYQGADQLVMQMCDVWLDFAIASCLKVLQILETGEEIKEPTH